MIVKLIICVNNPANSKEIVLNLILNVQNPLGIRINMNVIKIDTVATNLVQLKIAILNVHQPNSIMIINVTMITFAKEHVKLLVVRIHVNFYKENPIINMNVRKKCVIINVFYVMKFVLPKIISIKIIYKIAIKKNCIFQLVMKNKCIWTTIYAIKSMFVKKSVKIKVLVVLIIQKKNRFGRIV